MENISSINNEVISVGEGTMESPYLISNAAQLDWFRDQVNGGESSIHGALTTDITYNVGMDVEGYDGKSPNEFTPFTPIAMGSMGYKGVFDGRGHVISGLYVNWDGGPWCGLFGQVVRDGVVKDVTVRNSYFRTRYHDEDGSVHLGGIAGRNVGTISGCDVRATIVAASDLSGIECSVISCGGIVGSNIGSGTVSGCTSGGSVDVGGTATTIRCGGVVGGNIGSGTVSGCKSSVSIDVSGMASNIGCGGVTGYCDNTVASCTFSGNVDVSGMAAHIRCGGIVGHNTGTVGDCVSQGNALVSGKALSQRCCGGVVGVCKSTGTVKGCMSLGSALVSGVMGSRVQCGSIVGVDNSGAVTSYVSLGNVGAGLQVPVAG